MFYIVSTICFLGLSQFPSDLPMCFSQGFIKFGFQTKEECLIKRDALIDMVDEDLKTRRIHMILYCKSPTYIEETNV